MRQLIFRIPGGIRLAHWIIALAWLILLLSGLQIFNAHPALYWGSTSDFAKPFFSIGAENDAITGSPRGFVRIGSRQFDTTGILGLTGNESGQLGQRAFPRWLTLPSDQDLAGGRRWHFFFAWLLVLGLTIYVVTNLIGARARRDLLPTANQLRHIVGSIVDHARFRFPHGEEARHYNILQKLSYLGVMFGVFPLTVLSGLALSPAVDAALPWLTVVLGGRQSARSLHFICTAILALFFLVHLLMIAAAGPINEMRSIITGWFAIDPENPGKRKAEKS